VLFFSIAMLGSATTYLPDSVKARLAAALLSAMIDRRSTIDPERQGGLRPVVYLLKSTLYRL